MDIRQVFGEPYIKYVQSLQEAVTHPDLNAHAMAAYGEYSRAAQDALKPEDHQRIKEAYEKYVGKVQEAVAPAAVQKRSHDAFRAYVQSLHDAWSRVDVASLDAASLAAIAESMLNAAWLGHVSGGGGAPVTSTSTTA